MAKVAKLTVGFQSPIQSDEQQRRILVEPDAPNLSEAEDRKVNIQGGHEQDRLPSLMDVVAPGYPASKAMSHDDLVAQVAKAFRLTDVDAYGWIADGEDHSLRKGISTVQPTQPTTDEKGATKSRGQIQVNSGMFRNAWEEDNHPRGEDGQFRSRFDGAVDSLKADAERLGVSWSGRRPQYRKGSKKALVANEITCYRAQGMLSLERLGMTKDEARALAARGEVKLLAGRHVKDDPTVILPKGKLNLDGGGPGGAEGSMTGADVHTEVGGRSASHRSSTRGMIDLIDNATWDEDQHPRDEDGQFVETDEEARKRKKREAMDRWRAKHGKQSKNLRKNEHESGIDTKIMEAMIAEGDAELALHRSISILHSIVHDRKDREGKYGMSLQECLEKAKGFGYAQKEIEAHHAAKAALPKAREATAAAEEKYQGWSRFFLVTNANGHIHKSMSCSTCVPGKTRFAWLPQLSGLEQKDAVEDQGERLCTVCFPDAPSAWTDAKGYYQRLGKEAREAKQAERQGKKDEKAARAAERRKTHHYFIRFHRKSDGETFDHWEPKYHSQHDLKSLKGAQKEAMESGDYNGHYEVIDADTMQPYVDESGKKATSVVSEYSEDPETMKLGDLAVAINFGSQWTADEWLVAARRAGDVASNLESDYTAALDLHDWTRNHSRGDHEGAPNEHDLDGLKEELDSWENTAETASRFYERAKK